MSHDYIIMFIIMIIIPAIEVAGVENQTCEDSAEDEHEDDEDEDYLICNFSSLVKKDPTDNNDPEGPEPEQVS